MVATAAVVRVTLAQRLMGPYAGRGARPGVRSPERLGPMTGHHTRRSGETYISKNYGCGASRRLLLMLRSYVILWSYIMLRSYIT